MRIVSSFIANSAEVQNGTLSVLRGFGEFYKVSEKDLPYRRPISAVIVAELEPDELDVSQSLFVAIRKVDGDDLPSGTTTFMRKRDQKHLDGPWYEPCAILWDHMWTVDCLDMCELVVKHTDAEGAILASSRFRVEPHDFRESRLADS
jgi:hypothetical protein